MKPSFQTSSVCPENCHSAASAPTGGRARALPGEIHRAAASSQDFQGSGSPAEFHRRATRTVGLADTGTCGPLAVLPRSPARCHRLSAAGGRPPPACHAHLRKPTNGGTPGSWVVNTPLTPTAPDMQVFGGSMPITITAQSPTPAVPDSGVFAIPTVTATSSERADDAVTRARRKRAGYSMMAGVRHCGEYAAGDYSRY